MVEPDGGFFLGVLGIGEEIPMVSRDRGLKGVEEGHVFWQGHEAFEGDFLMDQLGAVLSQFWGQVSKVAEAEIGVRVEEVISLSLGDIGLFANYLEAWPEVNADVPLDALFGQRGVTGSGGVPSLVHFEVIVDSVHPVKCVNINFFFSVSLPNKVKILILSHHFFMSFRDSINDKSVDTNRLKYFWSCRWKSKRI